MIDTNRPYPTLGYEVEELDGEMVIFHPASMKVMHSNRTGALIWQLCDGQRTVADICRLLSDAYPNFGQHIETDVHKTLHLLAEHGAITWR